MTGAPTPSEARPHGEAPARPERGPACFRRRSKVTSRARHVVDGALSGAVMMIRAGLVLLLLLAAAVPARAHGWYTGLRNRYGISCCEDRDCRPVGLCLLPDRKQGLVIEGVCRPIPRDKVLDLPSPDGGAHACWQRFGQPPAIRCVILPGET